MPQLFSQRIAPKSESPTPLFNGSFLIQCHQSETLWIVEIAQGSQKSKKCWEIFVQLHFKLNVLFTQLSSSSSLLLFFFFFFFSSSSSSSSSTFFFFFSSSSSSSTFFCSFFYILLLLLLLLLLRLLLLHSSSVTIRPDITVTGHWAWNTKLLTSVTMYIITITIDHTVHHCRDHQFQYSPSFVVVDVMMTPIGLPVALLTVCFCTSEMFLLAY